MSFEGDLNAEMELTPEQRKRLAERSLKWRMARAVRENWTNAQHLEEEERLAREAAEFPVTRIPTPDYAGWQTRRPDIHSLEAGRVNKRAA